MSLDNTSRPGRPGPDGLAPSRYALRVGEIDVLVISDGVFPLDANTLATNVDPAALAAWLDETLQPPDKYTWPLNIVVVRSGGRTVLIDAGVGAEFPNSPGVGRLVTRLDAAGIDPASVTRSGELCRSAAEGRLHDGRYETIMGSDVARAGIVL